MIDNDRITGSQLWVFIVMTAVGVGIFSLPRQVAEASGPDGWITTIFGGLLALLDFYLLSRIAKRFPGDTLAEINEKVFGRLLGIVISLIFWAYILIIVSMTLRIFGEVVKMSLLLRTPVEVILISILVLTLMLARGGVEPIVRFDEITFPIVFVTIIFVIFVALPRSDFTNLLPVLRTPPQQMIWGAYRTMYAFAGYELVLLIIPFVQKPDKMFKSGIIAFLIMISVYTLVVILSFAKFGPDDTKKLIWPTLTMLRSIEVPGSFIERLEGLVMMQWVLFAFTTIVPFVYGLGFIPSRILKHSEFKHFCTIMVPMVYMSSLAPDNVAEAYQYLDTAITYLGAFCLFILPVFLLIVSSIRKVGVRKNA